MRVRHYAQGKFYTIACPEGTRIVRAVDQADGDAAPHDHLVVPLNGNEMRIPADPPELLPLLAETGHFGVLEAIPFDILILLVRHTEACP